MELIFEICGVEIQLFGFEQTIIKKHGGAIFPNEVVAFCFPEVIGIGAQ
jgi:hypothetical protein